MPTFPIDVSAGTHYTFGRPYPVRVPAGSRETVRVSIGATLNGEDVDPSAGEVSFAFAAPGTTPAGDDFVAGNWESTLTGWIATCLVGTGGVVVLAAGLWRVWVKVSDDPEIPVRDVGDLGVY